MKKTVAVTITVTVDGEAKTYTANASTEANPYGVAEGLLNGLHQDAQDGAREARYDAAESAQRGIGRTPIRNAR